MRKLSDAYVDGQIAKIDKIYEECTGKNLIVTPDCLMPETRFGRQSRISRREREQIKEYYSQLQNLSYVRGFWMGYSLRDGIKD
jgi:hypothetical protein